MCSAAKFSLQSSILKSQYKIRLFRYSQYFQGFSFKEESFFSETLMNFWGKRALRIKIKAIYRLPKKARNLLFPKVISVATPNFLNQNEHTQKDQKVPCTLWSWITQLPKSSNFHEQDFHEHHQKQALMFFLILICDWSNSVNTNLN